MKEISVFREKLHEHLQWNGARLLFVSMFLIALMRVKTVNLVEIVMKIPEPWVISIDRTDWRFGKTVFNVLTLGVVHHGIAFPLVWMMLDKKGNSNTRERCELCNRFLEIFGDRKIDFLTADREFVGEEWFD